jgi:hypothetical protein
LPVILYGYETWFLTLREGKLSEGVWEQGAEGDVWTEEDWGDGRWRKLHNEKLRDLCSSSTIIRVIKSRKMRLAGHVVRMGDKRNAHRLLVEKTGGRRPLGRPRGRWVDNIRLDLGEVEWGHVC